MPSLILIEKTGKLKSIKMDGLDIPNLCKKCGFKSIEGFALAHTWTVAFNEIEYKLCLYGKTEGRANSENKYEFPPPMDNTLFFGSCVVLNMENNEVSDISVKEFEDMMEHLYGGFEDVNSETTESEEETDLPKTKDGYVKDGFIVDSDEGSEGDDDDDDDAEEEEEGDDENDTEEEVVVKPKRAILPKVTPRKKAVKKEKAAPVLIDCSDELEEEEYLPMV